MRTFLAELHRRDRLLALAGAECLIVAAIAFGLMLIDDRQVLGIDPWIKPTKFALSFTAYFWTLGWFLAYLPGPRWAVGSIRLGVLLTMTIELLCISLQAARGTTSHFNTSTPLDLWIFNTMGIAIVLNTLFIVGLLILFCKRRAQLDPAYQAAICFGLLVFLVGSAMGGKMLDLSAHTVGLSDGGPGLPFVNWSTQGGDLRIAHFLGLHGFQLIPLAGYGIVRWKRDAPVLLRVGYVGVISVIYAGLMAWSFFQAMNGKPLVSW